MESGKGLLPGYAIIINNELFDRNDSEREGSSKDVENLETLFFQTQIYETLSESKTQTAIKNYWDVRMEVGLPIRSGLLKQISNTFDSYLNSVF
jgi:hypothetical protein